MRTVVRIIAAIAVTTLALSWGAVQAGTPAVGGRELRFELADGTVITGRTDVKVITIRIATIKLWDTITGKELLTLRGHSHWVVSVAFSPDGKRLASGSKDHTIKFWNIPDWTELPTKNIKETGGSDRAIASKFQGADLHFCFRSKNRAGKGDSPRSET